jgi:hypothetical protein
MERIENDVKRSLRTISIDGYDRNVALFVPPVLASFSFVAEVVGRRRHKVKFNSASRSRFRLSTNA